MQLYFLFVSKSIDRDSYMDALNQGEHLSRISDLFTYKADFFLYRLLFSRGCSR